MLKNNIFLKVNLFFVLIRKKALNRMIHSKIRPVTYNHSKIIITLLFLIISHHLSAQIKIFGKVVDEGKNYVADAEIILVDNSGNIVQNAFTNDLGEYALEINAGEYILTVQMIGLKLFSKKLSVSLDQELETITINPAIVMEEIQITSKKKIMERKVDRLVFYVENSIGVSGGDAFDALRITPGVRIQNDQISIAGKEGVAIMVNNKLINLSGEDLQAFLSSIPAESIKNIEVITTPPANYDAEGNSGIININTKKAIADNWSNRVRVTYKQATKPTASLANNFSYQNGRFSSLVDLTISKGTSIYTNDITYQYPSEYWRSKIENETDKNMFASVINLEYQASKNSTIGIQYIGNLSQPVVKEMGDVLIFTNDVSEVTGTKQTRGSTDKDYRNHSINLYLNTQIDTLGRQYSVNVDYFTLHSTRDNFFNSNETQVDTDNTIEGITENTSRQNIENFSSNIDFEHPVEDFQIFYGAKVSFTTSRNKLTFSSFNSTGSIIQQNNDFKYSENVQSAYISGGKKFGDKFELKAGLRMELTQTEGYTSNTGQRNNNNYTKLFPTVYLTYQLNDKNLFSLSYARRIRRPSYSNLNPARWYLNINSYEEGNPFLQPSYSNNIDLSHSYKEIFTTILSLSKMDNGFGQLTTHDTFNDIQSFIRRNYYDYYYFGLSEYITYDLVKNWNVVVDASAYYTKTKTYTEFLAPRFEGWGGYLSAINSFEFTSEKTITAQVLFQYNFTTFFNESKTGDNYNLGFNLRWMLLNKDLQLNLTANNILRSDIAPISNTTQGIYQTFRQYYDTQYVSIMLSYKFGNKKISASQRSVGNEDEQQRAN